MTVIYRWEVQRATNKNRKPKTGRQGSSRRQKRSSAELIREEKRRIVRKLMRLMKNPLKNMAASENDGKESGLY